MTEPKTVRVSLESPRFSKVFTYGWGDMAKMHLVGYREMRDGRWQEYVIELKLSPEELTCVISTARQTVYEMTNEMDERIADRRKGAFL